MTTGRHGVAAGAAGLAVLLAAGCSDAGQAPAPSSTLWPVGSQVELAATGMTLLGGAGSGDLVVDGAGMVWADGAWQVARIDPVTGAATTWDAADDAAFAAVQRLAPAWPAGVWMLQGGSARLFDGERFAMTLTVPDQYRQGEHPEATVSELLQVEGQVYVAGPAGVARWEAGAWTPIGADQLVQVQALALDAGGAVWAGGVLVDGDDTHPGVARLRADTWIEPDPRNAPTGEIADVTGDPTGGVWVASLAEGTPAHGIFHYDGTTWTKVGDGGYAFELGVTADGDLWSMTSGGDGTGGSGTLIAGRLAADGTWQAYSQQDGAPLADEGSSADLAVAGSQVLMLDEQGLVGLAGDRFEPVWADPAAVLLPVFGIPTNAVIARSADEVWLPATPMPAPAGAGTGGAAGAGLMRSLGGTWQRVGPDVAGDTLVAPVQASDGAIWELTRFGELVRIEGEDATVILTPEEFGFGAALAPADRGAVWTVLDGEVVRIAPDGTRRSVGAPAGAPVSAYTALVARGDEVVWVDGGAVVHQWSDGRWGAFPRPPVGGDTIADLLPAPDGSLWALTGQDVWLSATLARYDDGSWQVGPGGVRGLALAPDGTVCTMRREQADLACLDAGLEAVRTVPVGAWPDALGIAPDGAIWVVGEQVARLGTTVG